MRCTTCRLKNVVLGDDGGDTSVTPSSSAVVVGFLFDAGALPEIGNLPTMESVEEVLCLTGFGEGNGCVDTESSSGGTKTVAATFARFETPARFGCSVSERPTSSVVTPRCDDAMGALALKREKKFSCFFLSLVKFYLLSAEGSVAALRRLQR
jgi:hypothetical protein